jgi:L-arabinonolactonase
MAKARAADVVCDIRCELGEGPVWHAGERALYWLDGTGRALHRWREADGEARTWPMEKMPAAFAFNGEGTALLASRNGLGHFDFGSGLVDKSYEAAPADFAEERFNDGKCDARGRFWVGTMDRCFSRPIAHLYRIDPDLSARKMQDGMILSNGIAWSPDYKVFYVCESRPGVVYAFDFDLDEGHIANRRVLIDYAGRDEGPDGCAMDAEGGLWIAEIRAGRVARYTPDGKLDRVIETPVSHPTSVCFGGAALDKLFVTSMRLAVSKEALAANPLHGGLFVADAGVKGMPVHGFGN